MKNPELRLLGILYLDLNAVGTSYRRGAGPSSSG